MNLLIKTPGIDVVDLETVALLYLRHGYKIQKVIFMNPGDKWKDYRVIEDPIGYPDLSVVKIPMRPPSLTVPPLASWSGSFSALFDCLGNNVMAPKGLFDEPWVRPAPIFKGTWLWDNAFHSKIWSLCNLEFAKHVLDLHMKYQEMSDVNDITTYGRIPHSIEISGRNEWTQPPLMAWAYWELFKKNGSVEMLESVFSRLFAYHTWLNYNRDLNKDGLYSWVHPFESGLDNAPRYDEVSPLECNAVDFSALVSLQLGSLINMCQVLGDDTIKAGLVDRKRELDEWINEEFWNEDTGFYHDKAFEGHWKGDFIGPKMISGFYPLFAGIVPKDRIGRLLGHLTSPDEFWTTFPVATVALDEPSFSPDMNMWRGPIWINTNYMIVKGLKKYGFRELPGELAYITTFHVLTVHDKLDNFYEYYGSTGRNFEIESFARKSEKGGPRPYFVGWTGLVANMILEDVLGLECQHDAIMVNPSVPERLVRRMNGRAISGTLPGVSGWKQDRIAFTMTFAPRNFVEIELKLQRPMELHVCDYESREELFADSGVGVIQLEVQNNKDTLAILGDAGIHGWPDSIDRTGVVQDD